MEQKCFIKFISGLEHRKRDLERRFKVRVRVRVRVRVLVKIRLGLS